MTLYAGEGARITTNATDFDDVVITDDDVASVKVTIIRASDDVEVLAETDMNWDATDQEWYYDWDTTGEDPGTYIAKCQINGLGMSNWEFKRFRLNRNAF